MGLNGTMGLNMMNSSLLTMLDGMGSTEYKFHVIPSLVSKYEVVCEYKYEGVESEL